MAAEDIRVRAIIEAVDRATPVVGHTLITLSRGLRRVGAEMVILGGVVTGAGVIMARGAMSARSSIGSLSQGLEEQGTSWGKNKDRIAAVVGEVANLTATSRTDLLAALNQISSATGNIDVAIKSLPAAAVLARAMNVPIEEAAKTLIAAFGGDSTAIQALRSVGVNIQKEGASWNTIVTEVLSKFQDKVAAGITPFDRLVAAFKNVKDSIGTLLLPSLFDPIANKLTEILNSMDSWIGKNNTLGVAIATTFGVGGIVLVALGSVLASLGQLGMALSSIQVIFGISSATMVAFLGTVGLVALGIALFAAAVVLLITYWNQIRDAFNEFVGTTAGKIVLAFFAITTPLGLVIATLALLAFNWDVVWTFVVDKVNWAYHNVVGVINGMITGINRLSGAMNTVLGTHIGAIELIPNIAPLIGKSVGVPDLRTQIDNLGNLGVQTEETSFGRGAMPGWAGSSGGTVQQQNVTVNFNGPTYGIEDLKKEIKTVIRDAAKGGGFDATFGAATTG